MGNSAQVEKSGTQNEVNSFDVKAHMRKQWKIVGLSALALALMIYFEVPLTFVVITALATGILIGIAFTTWLEYGEEPQLSGKQDWLNPNAAGPERRTTAEDSKAGEFNGLTLEVNPKQESEQGMITPAVIGGVAGAHIGDYLGADFASGPDHTAIWPLGIDFWENAPEWSNYWAVDEDGMAWWYEAPPRKCRCAWMPVPMTQLTRDWQYAACEDWEHTLVTRPGFQEQY